MRKKRKSYSLVSKSVQNEVAESDILITGYISKELFLLIENLSDFTKNNFAELSIDELRESLGLSLNSDKFKSLMKDLCDVSLTINMQKKRGCFSIVDTVGLHQNECRLKLNESFIFLMNTDAFKLLSNYFDCVDFEYLE